MAPPFLPAAVKNSTSSSRVSIRTSDSLPLPAGFGPPEASIGLCSAASFVASSSGAPPIAVSLAAAPPPSSTIYSVSVAAAVRTIIGPLMPLTS